MMRFSESCVRALATANREAQRFRQSAVGTGHLLLALLQDETCTATVLLRSLGADTFRMRQSLESQLPEAAMEEPLGADPLPAGFTIDEKRVEELVRAGAVVRLPPDPGRLPQTATLKRSFEQAIAAAQEIGPSQELLPGRAGVAEAGTAHLLLGILLQGGGAASRILGSAGVDAAAVRDQLGRDEYLAFRDFSKE
jgi:ATP-dependent Clp protease ATP-binding subunit ClpA